ncbi:aldose 1-epimerase [Halosolutus halophilus]|uniref:aldose 1-epimerase n=1 Tax=Halosolutus halophilus TaxID=1552990 RepID=UPI00223515D3|nr:aldose 1-epimerase [Halosolutus halophilus]
MSDAVETVGMSPHARTEYRRKGLDVVFLENDHVHVEILAGKGGDITEFRDKRTDTNVLFEAPHEWRPPTRTVGAPDGAFTFLDHYPGGWQDVLPAAGGPSESAGASLALHGESSLVPFDVEVTAETRSIASVELTAQLTRYPLRLSRVLTLRADDPTLSVRTTAINEGSVPIDYSWLQHLAFGPPLVGPNAVLNVPCRTVRVDPDHDAETARLPAGERFDWPIWDAGDEPVDLRRFPPRETPVHDLVALCDLTEGRYTLSNPSVDLGVTVRFPRSLYEYVWYWQPLGGFDVSPFFGRAYAVGLEPCTSIPNAGLAAAQENGTANRLEPKTSVSATISVTTHSARS